MPVAYSYIRFSSHKQSLGDSLRRQLEKTADYVKTRPELELDTKLTYRDLGLSAFESKNAETGQLGDFLNAVKSGLIKHGSVLIVEALDRLSRDATYKAVALLGELVESGVEVVTLSDKMSYTSKTLSRTSDFFYSVMQMSRSHEESERKSDLISQAYVARRLSKAKIICNIAPGWLIKDKKEKCWTTDDKRAESVKFVYQNYLDGMSAHAICQKANLENWPQPSMRITRKAEKWHVSLVRRILSNPATTGRYIERSGIEHADFFPRIISDEEFAKAQALANKKRAFPRRRDNTKYNVFQGLIYCGYCGATMGYRDHGLKSPEHQGETRRYFCTAHVRGATSTCKTRPGAQTTQTHLIRGIYRLAPDIITPDEEIDKLKSNLDAYKELEASLIRKRDRLVDAIAMSDITVDILTTRLEETVYRIKSAKDNVIEAENKLSNALVHIDIDGESLDEAISKAIEMLEETPESREKLRIKIFGFVEKVYLYGREGVANVIFHNDKIPYLIKTNDRGDIIKKNGKPIFRMPIPA